MDPWWAVDPVPYLCAINLISSCEEFSEPKRMSRGTRNYAHVNTFSILAPDDNELTGDRTSMPTSRDQCQQWKCGAEQADECRSGDERVDECRRGDEQVDECTTAPETKTSSHRGSNTLKLNAHQVSYLATSGGDSKGVHHVSG